MGTEVDGSGCPVPISDPEGFTFEGSVSFGFDSAQLTPQSEAALRAMGEILIAHAGVSIILEGHADSEGAWYVNHGLSLKRAYLVRDFLVENFPQLATGEFSVVGIGDTRPIADNATAQGRAQNRRVVVIVR
jgi:OOP family OmpA-OmpF porin